MKLAHNFYPSHIAKILAMEVGLLSDMETDYMLSEQVREERDRLIEFQQMSLVNSFDDCLVVYFGIDLSKKQIESLRIIYEVTPQLLTGSLFNEAMGRIADEKRKIKPNMAVIASSLHTAINLLTRKKVA